MRFLTTPPPTPIPQTVPLGPPNRTSPFTTLCLERETERIRGTNGLVGRVAVNTQRETVSNQRARAPTSQSQNTARVGLMRGPRRLSSSGPPSTTRASQVRGAISRLPERDGLRTTLRFRDQSSGRRLSQRIPIPPARLGSALKTPRWSSRGARARSPALTLGCQRGGRGFRHPQVYRKRDFIWPQVVFPTGVGPAVLTVKFSCVVS
jgi:hypothetical protein